MNITVTLGKAGCLVVPKAIRESLGLREGTRLRAGVLRGKIEAISEPDEVQIKIRDGIPVITGLLRLFPTTNSRV